MSRIINQITDFIKREIIRLKKDGAVIGISGGIDSAVTLALCRRALGDEGILALIMPEYDSDPESLRLAKMVTSGVKNQVIPIGPILKQMGIYNYFRIVPFQNRVPYNIKTRYVHKMFKDFGPRVFLEFLNNSLPDRLKKSAAYFRTKNRVRMTVLYQKAEEQNYAVVGTINRTEFLLGFFVPFGDGTADIMPLINFYKTDVKKLARELEIPEVIRDRPPTPDLIPGISDEMILGMSYDLVDDILMVIEGRRDRKGIDQGDFEYVEEIYEKAGGIRSLLTPQPEEFLK